MKIVELIYAKLDELRSTGMFSYHQNTDIDLLEKIGNDIGIDHLNNVLKNEELFNSAIHPNRSIPNFIIDFISLFVQDKNPISILDPWITRDSYVVRKEFRNYSGYCFASSEYNLLTKVLLQDKRKILECPELPQLLKEERTFDMVISFPPLGMKSTTNKDISVSSIIESAKRLNTNGSLIFLVSPKIIFNKKIKEEIISNNISIDGVFYIQGGALYPFTTIESYLIVASNRKGDSTFVAKIIDDFNFNKTVYRNFINEKIGQKTELGKYIKFSEFTSFINLLLEESIFKVGQRMGFKPIILGEIGKIKSIRTNKADEVQHITNSIYIPKIGNSSVISHPLEFNIKPINYLQVVLNEDVNSQFLSSYLNTSHGKQILESRKTGVSIKSISKSALQGAPLFIPDYQKQLDIIELDNKIENLILGLSDVKQNLWNKPRNINKIKKEIKKFDNLDRIEHWLDSLPFPLSSILWKYNATSNNKEKVEHLLHFFEALSEFLSLLILSAFNHDKKFYSSECHRWITADDQYSEWYKKTTFGGWNNLYASLAKATRTFLSDENKRELVKSLFGNPPTIFFDFISNKKNVKILDFVRELRNKWKGHGGISGKKEDQNRLTLLENKLNEFRSESKDVFTDSKLIIPSTGTFNDGVFTFKVREFVGTRIPLNEIQCESVIPLNENKLYLYHQDQSKPIELLPFIKYNQESNACYFYNSIESNDIRWISFHFEKNSELLESLDEKFEGVLDILKQNRK